MKKKLAAIAVSLMAVVSLAGCSGKLSNDYITINQYKGLEVTEVASAKVTDDDVEAQIESNLSATATTEEITDRAAEDGDTVNINYSSDFENSSSPDSGADLTIGSDSYVKANGDYKGFSEQIIGHKPGETFDIQVKFPDDYASADLAGQVKTFSITVNSISKSTTPELTDEWVKANSQDSATVEEYKKEVKKSLEKSKKESTNATLRSEVLSALLDQVKVEKYPDGEVEDQVSQMTDYYKSYAEQSQMEFADFLEQQLGMSEDDFTTEVKSAAEQTVKQKLAVDLIADKKKLTPSDKEYEKEFEKLAESYGYEDVDSLKEAATEDTLKSMILQQKVADYLIESCVQVEASSSTTDDAASDTAK
ncbi:MAG: trigger factor [Hespellia sp.]|nr:trigger factor [Hespellia sp.]